MWKQGLDEEVQQHLVRVKWVVAVVRRVVRRAAEAPTPVLFWMRAGKMVCDIVWTKRSV